MGPAHASDDRGCAPAGLVAGGILDDAARHQGQVGGLLAVSDPNDPNDPNDPFGDFLYCYDGNGNVSQVVDWSYDSNDPAGAIVAKYEYDPYGQRINHDPNVPEYDQPWRFSTKQFDVETGLGYWGYRYYSPGLGRWISRDPAAEDAGPHLYAFVSNRPTDRYDFLGRWGSDMHYDATYAAAAAYMNKTCADALARSDQNVDTFTGASLFPFFHFDKDVDGNPFSCGRSCWFERRWMQGNDILMRSDCPDVFAALGKFGEALHSFQDGSSHSPAHDAETPFDHAPSWICLLWGDPWGRLYPRCIAARENNPNWSEATRPDKRMGLGIPKSFATDFANTVEDTRSLIAVLSQHPAIRCRCARD